MSYSDTPLLLASASPRRRELLAQIGVRFETAAHRVDESRRDTEQPRDYVIRMACEKAACVAERQAGNVAVLGADTAVVIDGEVLGKPADRADAVRMLQRLSGARHQVLSAVALYQAGRSAWRLSVTDVAFRPLRPGEAAAYWNTGEPCDKAGAYGVQGIGALFVETLSGSYSGVVGLPLRETAELLALFGVPTAIDRAWSRSGESGA